MMAHCSKLAPGGVSQLICQSPYSPRTVPWAKAEVVPTIAVTARAMPISRFEICITLVRLLPKFRGAGDSALFGLSRVHCQPKALPRAIWQSNCGTLEAKAPQFVQF